ncbi:MAG: fibronectin type III domain-containing protein [Jatrophihabitans sp.]
MKSRRRVLSAGLAALLVAAGLIASAGPLGASAAHNPVGSLDTISSWHGVVTMAGWSLDRDHLAGEQVGVWQQSPAARPMASVATGIVRADVNAALHVSGAHGWRTSFAAASGHYTFCAYGINIGPGSNVLLGCRTLTVVAGWVPVGGLTPTATVSGPQVTITGYAFDRDDLLTPERVSVYQQGSLEATTTTTVPRPDINARYGIAGTHGWSATFTVPDGQHTFCAYAINAGPAGANAGIGCLVVVTPGGNRAGPVTNLLATSTPTSITLNWTNPTDGYYSGIRITRQIGGDIPSWQYPTFAELPADSTSFTDFGLVNGITYTYSVFTHDTHGNYAQDVWSVTTPKQPCTAVCAWGGTAIGTGPNSPSATARPLPVLNLAGASQIAGAAYSTLALQTDGTVHAWGTDAEGELGDNGASSLARTPVPVPGLTGVTAVAAGGQDSYALRSDGTVWGWGSNTSYQLGKGQPAGKSLVPVQIPTLSGVTAIAAGTTNAYALRSDGTVWAWGANAVGALGAPSNSPAPVQVTGLSGVTALAAGQQSAYALRSDGTVWAWGNNNVGQLGDGTVSAERNAAAPVPGLTGVTALSAGGRHVSVVRSDGTVWAWGSNINGELGNASLVASSVPVQVSGLTGIGSLASGQLTSYALGTDGRVWAWGSNYDGNLGGQAGNLSTVPVLVPGLSGVTVIGAGENTAFAVLG